MGAKRTNRWNEASLLAKHMSNLIADDLTKQYATRSEPLQVLRGVSFQLGAGESLAILGPSGSGKSTLLHILGTLDSPDSGKMTLHGEDPFLLDEAALATFRNRRVGFVFQDHHLLPQLSALENVLVPTLATGRVRGEEVKRGQELLERVGLAARADHLPAELSGGERQRVAIARALIQRPELLLADEPTGNLDRKSSEMVSKLLLELQARDRHMLILVTHNRDLAALVQYRFELDEGVLKSG